MKPNRNVVVVVKVLPDEGPRERADAKQTLGLVIRSHIMTHLQGGGFWKGS